MDPAAVRAPPAFNGRTVRASTDTGQYLKRLLGRLSSESCGARSYCSFDVGPSWLAEACASAALLGHRPYVLLEVPEMVFLYVLWTKVRENLQESYVLCRL